MALVVAQTEVGHLEFVDRFLTSVFDIKRGQGQGGACELFFRLLDCIKLNMSITDSVYKFMCG